MRSIQPTPFLTYALSLMGFVAFWWLLSILKADPLILPSPLVVAETVIEEAQSGKLGRHVGMTLYRMSAAFAIAMLVGSALGLLFGRLPRLDRWAQPWVTIFLNIPALVVIVLCYLWIGLNEVAVIAAVAVNKTAMVTVTLREGARVLSPSLEDMARVYRLSGWERLRHVWLPQLAPFFLTAARSGIAMIWKVVLVAEFLGRSSGIGFQIHLNFQLFNIAGVLAYAVAFIVVMLVIEFVLFGPLDHMVNKWRQGAGARPRKGVVGVA